MPNHIRMYLRTKILEPCFYYILCSKVVIWPPPSPSSVHVVYGCPKDDLRLDQLFSKEKFPSFDRFKIVFFFFWFVQGFDFEYVCHYTYQSIQAIDFNSSELRKKATSLSNLSRYIFAPINSLRKSQKIYFLNEFNNRIKNKHPRFAKCLDQAIVDL